MNKELEQAELAYFGHNFERDEGYDITMARTAFMAGWQAARNFPIFKQHWPTVDRAIITHPDTGSVIIVEIFNQDIDDYKKGEAFIWNFYIPEEHRGNGLGKTLLQQAEQYAKDHDAPKVYLEWSCEESPEWVFHWYERQGYKEVQIGAKSSLLSKSL